MRYSPTCAVNKQMLYRYSVTMANYASIRN